MSFRKRRREAAAHVIRVSFVVWACLFPAVASFAVRLERPAIAPSALYQIRTLEEIKAKRTPSQEKIDSRLFLASLHRRNAPGLAPLTDFRFLEPDAAGRVDVDIILSSRGGMKPVLSRLEALGEVVRGSSAAFRRVAARIRLENLEELAAMPEVHRVRHHVPHLRRKINTSEGDVTHGAVHARSFYGVDGSGVKIGVISDGVDSLAALQASGDLPPSVQILPGQAGTGDEGTAMLEIVHDLAPGAELAFATAIIDEAQFAQNILDLAAAGCDVIVDDILYLDESPFQDGPVAQAVDTVTAAGVLYFSSAGNEGNKVDQTSGTWEGDFSPNGTPAVLAGAGPVHDFGDGGQSIRIEFALAAPVVLIWAEHYDLSTGDASTDFDLYALNDSLTTIFDASTDLQDGVGGDDFPFEILGPTFTNERLVVARYAAGSTSSVPMFNLAVFGGELDDALATSGATRGHSAAVDAFSVAATPAAAPYGATPPGPYPSVFGPGSESESFSSDGPRRIILSPTGAELTPDNRTSTGGVVRAEPDITAADGVSCAAPGFDPFYGTSAAAPHAAAIAALLKSAVPSLTPAQIRAALVSSAIDIEAPGHDGVTGAGIVMADAALQAAGAAPAPALHAGAAISSPLMGDGDGFVESNEVFSVTVPLSNDGGAAAVTISAELTSPTPGVTINAPTTTYPDLAPGASAGGETPFVVTVGPSVPCGSTIDFLLTVTYLAANSPRSFPFTMRVGEPGPPMTFSFAGLVPIPDAADLSGANPGAPAIASLDVAGLPGTVYDIDFRIDGASCNNLAGSTTVGLDHSFVSDLRLTLRAPGGQTVLVADEPDGSGNNFCQTLLDDEGGGPDLQTRPSETAPFTGTFTPASPLSAFQGVGGNGTWQLEAQDFFEADTGNIRAFSLIITPAICNAPALTATVTGTKTVSGTFSAGGTVTYIVTLTNLGGLPQADNPGDEFVDVLPESLTLAGATATSGDVVVNLATNTVTWNGALAALDGSATMTITATVDSVAPATVVTSQGSIRFDADANGVNETITLTDDPSIAGLEDPTTFVVIGASVTGTKSVSGSFRPGGTVTYTIILVNSGNVTAGDNPGDELTDVLPAALTLVGAGATAGTAVADPVTNTVAWNGSVPAGGIVTITIAATIDGDALPGTTISNQATYIVDSDANGTNDAAGTSDDPNTAVPGDATAFALFAAIPTVTTIGLMLLSVGLALVAVQALKG